MLWNIIVELEPWGNLEEKEVVGRNQHHPIARQSQPCQCKKNHIVLDSCHNKKVAPNGYEERYHYHDQKFPRLKFDLRVH